MKEHVHINLKSNPVLLDRCIQNIQETLKNSISWLDYSFGRCYKITDFDNNIKHVFPAVYNSNREYISVLPNDNFGNFSFFDVYDPQKIDNTIIGKQKITFKCGLVFWFKLDEIYADETMIHTEEIKHEILTILKKPGLSKLMVSLYVPSAATFMFTDFEVSGLKSLTTSPSIGFSIFPCTTAYSF